MKTANFTQLKENLENKRNDYRNWTNHNIVHAVKWGYPEEWFKHQVMLNWIEELEMKKLGFSSSIIEIDAEINRLLDVGVTDQDFVLKIQALTFLRKEIQYIQRKQS